jgi:hypothetical protein
LAGVYATSDRFMIRHYDNRQIMAISKFENIELSIWCFNEKHTLYITQIDDSVNPFPKKQFL